MRDKFELLLENDQINRMTVFRKFKFKNKNIPE